MLVKNNMGWNLFDDFFNDPVFQGKAEQQQVVMRTDIMEKEGNFLLEIELPGFQKDDLQIELKDGYMKVSAQRAAAADVKYLHRERQMGSCSRTFYVGADLREEDIRAAYRDGVLYLAFPNTESRKKEEKQKFIPID